MNEIPDNAASNRKRADFMVRQLADSKNIMINRFSCFGHQLHNILVSACDEKALAGDVHAVAFSCSKIGHKNKLQSSLRKLVQHMAYHRTPPHLDWHAQHKSIVGRTLCRRLVGTLDEETGAEVDGLSISDLDPANPKRQIIDSSC